MTSKLPEEKILPFEIGHLPPFSVQKSEEELNESPERRARAVQELRSLLQKSPTTSGIDFHEDLLVSYLRRHKYRRADAQRQIQSFVQLLGAEGPSFRGVPDACLDLPSARCLLLLPLRCREGCALFLCRWGLWDPGELPFEQLKRVMATLLGQALRDPMAQIHGLKVIHDWKGASLGLARHLTPSNVLFYYNTTMNCLPARWKEFHVVNQSPVVKLAWNAIKPFLSGKMRSRVNFHNHPEELLDYFPRRVLPAEYGGCVRETEMSHWIKRANKEQQSLTLQGQPNYY